MDPKRDWKAAVFAALAYAAVGAAFAAIIGFPVLKAQIEAMSHDHVQIMERIKSLEERLYRR